MERSVQSKNTWIPCSDCESETRWVRRHTGTTTDKPSSGFVFVQVLYKKNKTKQKLQPELEIESEIKKGNTLSLKQVKIEPL